MRYLIVLVSACGFSGPNALVQRDASGVSIDAPRRDGTIADVAITDAAIDGKPMIDAGTDAKLAFACNSSSPAPRACFRFENNVSDSSGFNVPISVTMGSPNYANGEDGMAIALGLSDEMDIDMSSANLVSFPVIGVKTYVNIPTLPVSPDRMGIIDNNAYRMFVVANGQVRCAIGNSGMIHDATTIASITANAWVRITCTYDGTAMQIFFNGTLQAVTTLMNNNAPIPTVTTSTQIAGNQPSGDNLTGYLDDFEIFNTTQFTP